MVLRTFDVLFVERTSGGPHAYICAKNSGVRQLESSIRLPQRISVWLLFSKGLRSC
jgi:hypothetical protein